MADHDKNTRRRFNETPLKKLEKLHPHKMMLLLTLFGSSLIFLFMLVAYSYSIPNAGDFVNINLPKIFTISLFILLVSSYLISYAIPAFKEDNLKKLRNVLGFTLVLGTGFIYSQYLGWLQLHDSGIFLSGRDSGAYLYVITGLHLFHIISGILFLGYTFYQVAIAARDPVKNLIMVTNPYHRIKLEILTIYWHFLDIMWVILFFFLLFSF